MPLSFTTLTQTSIWFSMNCCAACGVPVRTSIPWEASGAFSPLHEAVLRLTDTMTREVQVPCEVMREVRAHLDDREVVELVGTIAAYNMVSRLLEALQIHSDDARHTGPGY